MLKRRRHLRVRPHPSRPVEVQLMGRTTDDPGGWETGAQTFLDVLPCMDVSVGGVAIRVEHGFTGCRIDDVLRLILSLPGQKPFSLRAQVRHIADLGDFSVFGVEFVELDTAHHAAISTYVDEMMACGRLA